MEMEELESWNRKLKWNAESGSGKRKYPCGIPVVHVVARDMRVQCCSTRAALLQGASCCKMEGEREISIFCNSEAQLLLCTYLSSVCTI